MWICYCTISNYYFIEVSFIYCILRISLTVFPPMPHCVPHPGVSNYHHPLCVFKSVCFLCSLSDCHVCFGCLCSLLVSNLVFSGLWTDFGFYCAHLHLFVGLISWLWSLPSTQHVIFSSSQNKIIYIFELYPPPCFWSAFGTPTLPSVVPGIQSWLHCDIGTAHIRMHMIFVFSTNHT